MNDAADEPSKPTSAEHGFRKLSYEELEHILADHKKWVEAEDRTGLDDLRADLSRADLKGAQLQGAKLDSAQLQGAWLSEAHLQWASLNEAQLQGAWLPEARLQGASLFRAQLQGAFLFRAQLQGVLLIGAHLRGADLADAKFEGREIKEDGEPGRDLAAANLTDADFRDADLSNAQLSTVTGLRAEMLAGAVLTNAKLPEDVARFDQLKHVEETSRNATTVFFGLLAASLYSWLTIATTTDVALVTGTTSSPLPIINTNIALSGFYLAAPLILLAVYSYFHLYLQRLWGDLASLPAVFPDGVALDRKAYPWLLNGLVRKHFKKLELAERPLTRVENFVSIFLAWWVVPLTLLAFWLRFLPRHDWWLGTPLHVVLIALAAGFGVYSYRLAVQTLSGGAMATEEEQRGNERLWARTWRTVRRYLPGGMEAAGAGVATIVVFSAGTWIDPGDNLLNTLGYDTNAELWDEDISTKPSGWTGREETAEVEISQVKGADLEGRDLRNAGASGAFLVNAELASADLNGALLFQADLRGADLFQADLSDARLSGADLRRARLGYADLSGADLSDAHLRRARLGYADLSGANLFDADLNGAFLSDANLRGADLRGAVLSFARNLIQAQLDEACGDDKTQLPDGLKIRTCPVTAPPASPSPPPGSS
jgi:uncharacterized protein YjbI with pentapeptide repeats